MVVSERVITELSSLLASSTMSLFGAGFFFRMASGEFIMAASRDESNKCSVNTLHLNYEKGAKGTYGLCGCCFSWASDAGAPCCFSVMVC